MGNKPKEPTNVGKLLRRIAPRAYGINPNPLGPGFKKSRIGYAPPIPGTKPSNGKPLEPAMKKGGSAKSKPKSKKK